MPDPTVHMHLHRMVALGLNTYEAKAYLSLVLKDSFAAAELATQAGIPRQRIYDVLTRLVQRGLARDSPGRVTRYSATDPETAIGALIAAQRRELDDLASRSQSLTGELQAAWLRGRSGTTPGTHVEVLRDPALLTVRAEEVEQGVSAELLTLATAAGGPLGAGPEFISELVSSGATVRGVYEAGRLQDADQAARIQACVDAGQDVRVADRVPMDLVLADGARAVFTLARHGADATSTSLLIEHPDMAASLRLTFDAVWSGARPLGHRVAATTDR
jgi:HTH-type transcriptional regulator, sugar sensing transcriptional regulator